MEYYCNIVFWAVNARIKCLKGIENTKRVQPWKLYFAELRTIATRGAATVYRVESVSESRVRAVLPTSGELWTTRLLVEVSFDSKTQLHLSKHTMRSSTIVLNTIEFIFALDRSTH